MAQAERKESMTNDLAQGFYRAYEGLKRGPSRGMIIGLAVIVGVALIILVILYFWRDSQAAVSKRWVAVDEVVFPKQFETARESDELRDTPQAKVLQFMEARRKLSQGVRDLGSADVNHRRRARKSIEDARDSYAELSKKASSLSPQLHQEAIWGEAKANEALGTAANLDAAVELYRRLHREYPTSALGKDARRQIDRLDDKRTREEILAIGEDLKVPAPK
jgi:hypothetical protein